MKQEQFSKTINNSILLQKYNDHKFVYVYNFCHSILQIFPEQYNSQKYYHGIVVRPLNAIYGI